MNHPTSPDPPEKPSPESASFEPIMFEFSEETSNSQETFVPGVLTGPPIPRRILGRPATTGCLWPL